MFHFFQTFPLPPADLAQLFSWIAAPETLFAFFLLYLKIPQIQNWADWEKGSVFVVIATVVSGLFIGLQMVLSPELIGKIQPFYTLFVIILTLVLGYFGVRNVIVRPIRAAVNGFKVWWNQTLDIRWAKAAADLANRTSREPDEAITRKFLNPRRG